MTDRTHPQILEQTIEDNEQEDRDYRSIVDCTADPGDLVPGRAVIARAARPDHGRLP